MNTTRTKETMKTKIVDTAKVVLEVYDTKFVMKSEDLESGEWEVNISYSTGFPHLTKNYTIDDFFSTDEYEMEERLWQEVFWFLQKYHNGADVYLESKEVEDEDED